MWRCLRLWCWMICSSRSFCGHLTLAEGDKVSCQKCLLHAGGTGFRAAAVCSHQQLLQCRYPATEEVSGSKQPMCC